MNMVEKTGVASGAGARLQASDFARRLWREWKRLELPTTNERVVIGASGGADSTALVLALDELKKAGRLALRFTVAHLDHGLRQESGEDARWVRELARSLDCEFELKGESVNERARITKDNLEQAARRARYEFFAETAQKCGACAVLTAHTMDDQAETVLLRLLRGSGAEGLSGIDSVRRFGREGDLLLVRPLLGWARRAETENYCLERNVAFRVDEMNRDESFARVRVRRQLLPLMQTFNGRIVEALSRTSRLLQEDASALALAGEKLLNEASAREADERPAIRDEKSIGGKTDESEAKVAASEAVLLRVDVLACAPVAVRRRALRRWIEAGRGDLRRLEMIHLLAVDKLVEGASGGRVAELPGGAFVERRRGRLRLCVKKVEKGNAAV